MIIGVPKEIKQGENRVAMTPAGVEELTRPGNGHRGARAGAGSGIADEEYEAAGATLAETAGTCTSGPK